MNTTIKNDNNFTFCFEIFFESLITYGYGKFSLRLIGSAMFGATVKLVTSVRVP